ncbi:GP46-like surface antigen, putative, partial [Bodo saltans]
MMLFLKVLVAAVNLVVMVDGFCPCASQAPILETLYHATNGSGWLNPWDLASVDAPCSWTGVTCTSGGAIIGLNLSLRQLSGTIPKVITNLTSLQTLYLGFNRLQGTLHTEYQLLTQLTVFYFRENLLTGTLPPEY